MAAAFVFFVSLVLLAALGVLVWVLVRSVREQAVLRRTVDVEMLEVLLPRDVRNEEREEERAEKIKEKISVAEQFLSTFTRLHSTGWQRLLYGRAIMVFEIVVHSDGLIRFYAGTERRYLDHLEKQIYALYPEADVRPSSDYTIFEKGDAFRGANVRLGQRGHLPIATYRELEADPVQSLTGALAKVQKKDAAVIQFVCRSSSPRVRRKGKEAARRTTRGEQSDVRTGSFEGASRKFLKSKEQKEKMEEKSAKLTPRSQERVELVEHKVSQPQFDVNIRVGVSAREPEETHRVFEGLAAAFSQYDLPDLNYLRVGRVGKSKTFIQDLIFRVPREKTASTLSTTELASLFHFPLPGTETPNILWRGAKVAPAPAGLPREGMRLGNNVYRGVETPIFLSSDDRRRHVYVIGQTGTGKTTLFLNMIIQDIKKGRGVGVVDPHGDLIEDILLHVPRSRTQDVILFDPRDTKRPPGFNILQIRDEAHKDMIVNEVVQILQKLAARLNPESVGPMFEHYLRNALLALVEDKESTLIDVPRMFVDETFRQGVLSKVDNPTVRQFWDKEFKQSQKGQLSADMLSYVISKLGRFVSNRTMRNLIGQAESSFDVREVMDNRKILLANLSKGSLGDINSDLLGFVLVSKIQIAAMARADVGQEKRPDFYLYLDEFQNFTTDSIVTILSEARKYRLNLNLTHQFISQLEDNIREAVFGNVGTVISYRVGPEDTEILEKQFEPVFTDYDLVNFEQYAAGTRLLVEGTPKRAFTLKSDPPPVYGDPNIREETRRYSREKYGRPVDEVEERIIERFSYKERKEDGEERVGRDKEGYMSESLFDVN